MDLLGVSNIAFWPLFTATGMTAAGFALALPYEVQKCDA
jgi:hypothetical protein